MNFIRKGNNQFKKRNTRDVVGDFMISTWDHISKTIITVWILSCIYGATHVKELVPHFAHAETKTYVAQVATTTYTYGYEAFNSDLQDYINERVKVEMENPNNKAKYKEMVEEQVIKNINILTKTSY